MSPRPFYFLGNARSMEQYRQMVALEAAGICIFCPESYTYNVDEREVLLAYDGGVCYRKQVLSENQTWVILRNEFPYPSASSHVMLVPREHVAKQTELSPAAKAGYWDILEEAAGHFASDGYYCLGSRNGDMRFTAGTIGHLHIQFVVGIPGAEAVKFYMSSDPNPLFA